MLAESSDRFWPHCRLRDGAEDIEIRVGPGNNCFIVYRRHGLVQRSILYLGMRQNRACLAWMLGERR